MSRVQPSTRVAALLLALGVVATSCGGDNDRPPKEPVPKAGGTLKILSSGDVDSMDPGRIYATFSSMLFRVMVRNLVTYAALPGGESNKIVADVATTTGTISTDGLTYTFDLKPGVKYQPHTAGGREVTSADFRYAIERGFYPSVANGYAQVYFSDLFEGDEVFLEDPKPGVHITGINVATPNRISFKLKRPTGDFLYRLAMPLASPVPEEYARAFDARAQSAYSGNFAATGPYMLERDEATRKVTGWEPTRSIALVRNPSWDAKTDDIRKAYPDRIEVDEGEEDLSAATQKILSGEHDLNGDFVIPPERIETIAAAADTRERIYFNPGNCMRYVSLNTAIPPFDNVKVRQAVSYALDKKALRATRGGRRVGEIATHALLPGVNGYAESGGKSFDPYTTEDFSGNLTKAQELMREAGFPSGRYEGKETVYLVGITGGSFKAATDIVQATLESIGFKVEREEYPANVMYTRYAAVPDRDVNVLSNTAFCWDYPDGFPVIGALFDGRKITEVANTNYSQLNDDQLNALIDRAAPTRLPNRGGLWAQANRRVMELAPIVPWLWDTQPTLISKRVVNYQYSLASLSTDLAVIAVAQPVKK